MKKSAEILANNMNEKQIEKELLALENKVEKLVAKFAQKTGQAIHSVFIEYMALEDEPDTIYPVAFASFECPHGEEAEIELEAGPLNLAPYGTGGIH